MDKAVGGFAKFVSSLLMLCAFLLAVALAAYQIFSPDGHVFQWLERLWHTSPALLLALGAAALLLKRRLDGHHAGSGLANGLLYLAVLIGLVAGASWLI